LVKRYILFKTSIKGIQQVFLFDSTTDVTA